MNKLTKVVQPTDVHRSASGETFLSHVTVSTSGVQGTVKPRHEHAYYGFNDPFSAVPLLYGLEVLRQAETYLAHHMDRPFDDHFIWRSITLHVETHDSEHDLKDHSFQLEHTGCVDNSRHQYRGRARIGNIVVVLDDFAVSFVRADMYARLPRISPCKSDSAPDWSLGNFLDAKSVGRHAPSDVAITTKDHSKYRVAAPYDSPVFFEHTQDHWPGMVLIDAATQLTALSLLKHQNEGARITSMSADFQRYSELSAPVDVTIHSSSSGSLHEVKFTQAEHLTTTVTLNSNPT